MKFRNQSPKSETSLENNSSRQAAKNAKLNHFFLRALCASGDLPLLCKEGARGGRPRAQLLTVCSSPTVPVAGRYTSLPMPARPVLRGSSPRLREYCDRWDGHKRFFKPCNRCIGFASRGAAPRRHTQAGISRFKRSRALHSLSGAAARVAADARHATSLQPGRILMARDRMITMVKSEIVLSIINILARRASGKASVGLKAVAVLYPRYR